MPSSARTCAARRFGTSSSPEVSLSWVWVSLSVGLPPELPEPGEPDRRQIYRPMRPFASLDEYKSLTLSYTF
jgi:hypothetical protein